MTGSTVDVFTPVHKAFRSMIYDLGGRLQSHDFGDLEASRALVAELEHDFEVAISAGCMLCLLHRHAGDEEAHVFPHVGSVNSDLVMGFVEEHHRLADRFASIARHGRAILRAGTPEERLALGGALNLEINEFFAAYLSHMNREEVELVPFLREHFTDDELRPMRRALATGMPPDRRATFLRYLLPALAPEEAVAVLSDLRTAAPPDLFRLASGIAAERLPAARWEWVRARAGL